MPKERDTPDDLYPFAQMLVKELKRKHQLQWNKHQEEDATQDLFLAGWQVWQDEEDVGLAKHRMSDRAKNLLRDFQSEQDHEPKAATEQRKPGVYGRWDENSDEDAVQRFDTADRTSLRGDPDQDAMVNEFLDQLTERQRRIVLLRMAGFESDEIARELGIGLRTVERELQTLRKDFPNDDAE